MAGQAITTTEPAVPDQGRVDVYAHQGRQLTPEQVLLIRDTVAKGATKDELRLFLAVAGRTGLDPFTRQIHCVKRWDSGLGRYAMAVQTGIDGYRVIAQRTSEYDGQDAKEWCDEDGKWSEVWMGDGPPHAARARVYRKGVGRPFTAVVRYSAYVVTKQDGTPNTMWSRMHAEQLAKCAEAAALRMAFPNELSEVLTDEEMDQASAVAAGSAVAVGAALTGVAGIKARLEEGAPVRGLSVPLQGTGTEPEPTPEPKGADNPAIASPEPSQAVSPDEGSPLFGKP